MKITKYVHACLLVETPERVALFDPGTMSSPAIDIDAISRLDDIFITHEHQDHIDKDLVQKLVEKFPDVRITSTPTVVKQLDEIGVNASEQAPSGAVFFDSPHEDVSPLFPHPEEIGVHYLGVLSHPGDSHSFKETKAILALPVSGPWASTIKAIQLAIELKPQYIIPIHDWHWSDAAREQLYGRMEEVFTQNGITFFKPETGQSMEIDIQTEAV